MTGRKFGGAQPKTRPDDKRGGKRAGAGGAKPSLSPNEPTVRKTVTLPQSMVERLERLGDGNVSLGIRRLLEATE